MQVQRTVRRRWYVIELFYSSCAFFELGRVLLGQMVSFFYVYFWALIQRMLQFFQPMRTELFSLFFVTARVRACWLELVYVARFDGDILEFVLETVLLGPVVLHVCWFG